MRIWLLPYSILDNPRLLAQHREIHMLAGLVLKSASSWESVFGVWRHRADYLAKAHQAAQREIELRNLIKERSKSEYCLSCGVCFKQDKRKFDVSRAESGFQCLLCEKTKKPISWTQEELWQEAHPPVTHKTDISFTTDMLEDIHPQEMWYPSQEAIRADVVALREKWEAEEYYFGVGRLPLAPFEASFDISVGLTDLTLVKQRREKARECLKRHEATSYPEGSRIRDRVAFLKAKGGWNA